MDRANPKAAEALRRLPSIDTLLRAPNFASVPRVVAVREARRFLDEYRRDVLQGQVDGSNVDSAFSAGGSAELALLQRCEAAQVRHHRRVINATGIVLHTGIGRAPLSPAARKAVTDAAGYSIVEIDPESGDRNQREACVVSLLRDILGVDGALVVNNNAAMVALVLRALANDKEVIISRGEQVEIGGGFRMPDVMSQAGCHMVEVGATNRCYVKDYEHAITEHTAMLLKIHTSNFRIVGFHEAPTLEDLVDLGKRTGLPTFEDLGSGLIIDDDVLGLEHEARVTASVRAGVPLVSFSGDKLLGGPQCGMLVGDKELCARVRAHPLYRAMRCDKLVLAALEATLRVYRDGNPLRDIPTLDAISRPAEQLEHAAKDLAGRLSEHGGEVVRSESFVGSGANPARPIPSFAVALRGGARTAAALRRGTDLAVIARIVDDRVLLDLRTLVHEDMEEVVAVVKRRLSPNGTGA